MMGRSGSARPCVPTRREDNALHRGSLEDHFCSASQVKPVSCFGGCSRTVINRLRAEYNIRRYRAGVIGFGAIFSVLENVFLPTVLDPYSEEPALFQQDNVTAHIVQVVQVWFVWRSEINLIIWPPKSPDFNVIENAWAKLKGRRREL